MFEHDPFGKVLRISIRGASHAKRIGFRLEGLPCGFRVDERVLAEFMMRRAPGRDAMSTSRHEDDAVTLEYRDGAVEGVIANRDVRPGDYGRERTVPRPGHSDFGQWVELGRIPTGGGMNSGRLTVAMCAAGGIALQLLHRRGISVRAEIVGIGGETDPAKFEQTILAAKNGLDSVGGAIRCEITGMRPGIGGALFAGLDGAIASAVFAIPGVKGIEFGNGFEAGRLRGTENNDPFVVRNGRVETDGNRHGGILGGRTSGMPVVFTVAMKPTPTVFREQRSVDLADMSPTALSMKGRHDPCIVRRAVPVVEAASALVVADAILAREAALPRICLTLTGSTVDEDVRQYESQRLFVDMVELRVDLLDAAERKKALDFPSLVDVEVILTFRRKRDGGAFEGDEGLREKFFADAIGRGFAYFDFEDDFRHPGLERLARGSGARVIRSLHAFDGKPGNVAEICRRLRGDCCDVAKLAFMPKCLDDVAEAFDEAKGLEGVEHIVCAMGAMGLPTRVLASRMGSMVAYASVGGLEGIGHLTPRELVRTYRFRTQAGNWRLYGVTGFPLRATRSPEIHNAAFAAEDEDAVMVPFPSRTADEAVRFMRSLGMLGMAVTIPHKQGVMPLVDELSEDAKAIGAVNTVSVRDGRLIGGNTDAGGFSEAIRAFAGRESFAGMRVALLGDGGAAKAVKWALHGLGAEVEVFHRRQLAGKFSLIVNSTPVDPIPEYEFTGDEMVYDLVYVPAETPLIARARKAGCRVENGFSMLVNQARLQREIWIV